MATSNSDPEVPAGIAVAIVALVTAAVAYVIVYGGDPVPLGSVGLGAIIAGMGLFTLYLFYRFVVAVEKIADTYRREQ